MLHEFKLLSTKETITAHSYHSKKWKKIAFQDICPLKMQFFLNSATFKQTIIFSGMILDKRYILRKTYWGKKKHIIESIANYIHTILFLAALQKLIFLQFFWLLLSLATLFLGLGQSSVFPSITESVHMFKFQSLVKRGIKTQDNAARFY